MKRPTLRDIAGRAEVSVSTVSRYLRGEMPLRSETEARIQEAMRHMDFSANDAAARRLVAAKTPARGVIGLVVPSTSGAHWGAVVDEIVRAAMNFDLETLIATDLESSVRHARYIQMFESGMVSGIISTGHLASAEVFRPAADLGIPCVIFEDLIEADFPLDCVMVDDYSGAYQATSLLIAHGHRDVAFVGGLSDLRSTLERQRGWREALARVEVDTDTLVQLTGDFTEEWGQAALSHLIDGQRHPTAVFAASDLIALGLMTAARQMNIEIPRDISLIGFDGIAVSSLVTPRLTTMRTPLKSMAVNAVRLLVDRMAEPSRPSTHLVSPVVVVSGDSVARIA